MGIVGFIRTWNEKDIIAEIVTKNREQLDELIVIDKGSTDGTWDILNSLDLKYLFRSEVGEDRELEDRKIGFRMAWMLKPDWVLQIDSDEILWSFNYPVKKILSMLPAEVDAVSVQLVDFFWNPADPEPFIYDGSPSIYENRKYVSVGHRWMCRISRPMPYIDYNSAVIRAKRCEYLNDFILRHYSHCANPERSKEKINRYISIQEERERDGMDMSYVDQMKELDYFNWDPGVLRPFDRAIVDRSSLESWAGDWPGDRIKWLRDVK